MRIDGEVWTARAYDEDTSSRRARKVQVVEIRGATALVAPMNFDPHTLEVLTWPL